jgi:hypothetical protein
MQEKKNDFIFGALGKLDGNDVEFIASTEMAHFLFTAEDSKCHYRQSFWSDWLLSETITASFDTSFIFRYVLLAERRRLMDFHFNEVKAQNIP